MNYLDILQYDTQETKDGMVNLAVQILKKKKIVQADINAIGEFMQGIVNSGKRYNVVLDVRAIEPFTYLRHVVAFTSLFSRMDGACICSVIMVLNIRMQHILPQLKKMIRLVSKKNIVFKLTET